MQGNDGIYEELKESILFLEIKPGSRIVEAEISKKFGVSRTPVREALRQLKDENLVEIYPQRGTYVTHIDLDTVKEMAYMRHIIEKNILMNLCRNKYPVRKIVEKYLLMMRLAFKNHDCRSYIVQDMKFHRSLFECGKHQRIWDSIAPSIAQYYRILYLNLELPDHLEQSLESHYAIVDCIEKGKTKELMELLESHHDHLITDADRKIMRSYPEYFVS